MFPCEISKVFNNTCFEEHLRRTAFKIPEIISFSHRLLTKNWRKFYKTQPFFSLLTWVFPCLWNLPLDGIWKYVENVLKLTRQTNSFTTRKGNERMEGMIVNWGSLIITSLLEVNYLYHLKIRFLNYSFCKKYISFAKLNYEIITLHWNLFIKKVFILTMG